MAGADGGAPAIGEAIAGDLGWSMIDDDDPHALHAIVAAVIGRREHLLAVTRPLTAQDRETIRGDLARVRFVDLSNGPAAPDEVLALMRREFGV